MKHHLAALAGSLALAGCTKGCGSSEIAIPDTPEGTVTTVAHQLSRNRPRVVWDALPNSWQSDVKGLLRTARDSYDRDLYTKGLKVSQKVVKVLESQRELIFGLLDDPSLAPMLKDPVTKDRAKLGQAYDLSVHMMKTLVRSDLATHRGLKEADVGAFLADEGATLMQDLRSLAALYAADAEEMSGFERSLQSLGNLRAERVSGDAQSATVRVTAQGRPKELGPEELELTRVEGRWVPAEMDEDWQSTMDQARTSLARVESLTESDKQKVLQALESVDAGLSALLEASTPEAFKQAAMGMSASLGARIMAMPQILR
ncbi:MAG TPA: hypothetical protein RMG48_14940 [Myxococcales bacterium LLY-WYZ-16_1]|nr:hypothetical protein [Myxococcales bacterium LLY-WYZ-16_1]